MTSNSIQAGVSTSLIETGSAAKALRAAGAASQTTLAPSRNDLQISSASTAVASAMTASDVRDEKVSAIRSAIEANTYNVAPVDVADKLIEGMLQS